MSEPGVLVVPGDGSVASCLTTRHRTVPWHHWHRPSLTLLLNKTKIFLYIGHNSEPQETRNDEAPEPDPAEEDTS